MMVDVQCYEGRSLDTVTQAETLAPGATCSPATTPTYTAATAMLETATGSPRSASPRCSSTSCSPGALRSLAEQAHDPGLVLDAYLLRALAVAGWAPSFHDCARCGAQGPHRAFNLAAGGTVCPVCRPPGSAAPAPETLALLGGAARRRLGGRRRLATSGTAGRAAAWRAAFLQWHLERGVRSLRLVERRDPSAPPPAPQLRVEAQA